MGLFKNIKDRLSEDAGKTGKTLNSVESEQSGEPSASDRDWPIIEHLAYYFMAYAYYADGNIDNMEMKKILELLMIMTNSQNDEDPMEKVQSIYNSAEKKLKTDSKASNDENQIVQKYLDNLIPHIKLDIPAEMHPELVKMLEDIGNADGDFSDGEKRWVEKFADDLGLEAKFDYGSEVEESKNDREWGIMEHLTYYFMAYANFADGNYDKGEMSKIFEYLCRWTQPQSEEEAEQLAMPIYNRAEEKFKGDLEASTDDNPIVQQHLDSLIPRLKQETKPDFQAELVNMLVELGNADGDFSDGEKHWVEKLADDLGLEAKFDYENEGEETKNDDVENKNKSKDYPLVSFTSEDEDETKIIYEHMSKWTIETKYYCRRAGIVARFPDCVGDINAVSPKWTYNQIDQIKKNIAGKKVIPSLTYLPNHFYSFAKQVWWFAPFVIWKEGVISWIFIDKNGLHAAHPENNDGALIFPWDNLDNIKIEWLYDSESEFDNVVEMTLYRNDSDSHLTFCEFVETGKGSYLEIIGEIYRIYVSVIEASLGESTWFHGVGKEGYKSFDSPDKLLDDASWEGADFPNPAFFGYVAPTDETEDSQIEDYDDDVDGEVSVETKTKEAKPEKQVSNLKENAELEIYLKDPKSKYGGPEFKTVRDLIRHIVNDLKTTFPEYRFEYSSSMGLSLFGDDSGRSKFTGCFLRNKEMVGFDFLRDCENEYRRPNIEGVLVENRRSNQRFIEWYRVFFNSVEQYERHKESIYTLLKTSAKMKMKYSDKLLSKKKFRASNKSKYQKYLDEDYTFELSMDAKQNKLKPQYIQSTYRDLKNMGFIGFKITYTWDADIQIDAEFIDETIEYSEGSIEISEIMAPWESLSFIKNLFCNDYGFPPDAVHILEYRELTIDGLVALENISLDDTITYIAKDDPIYEFLDHSTISLFQGNAPENPDITQLVTFLYVSVAYLNDGVLSDNEMLKMVEKHQASGIEKNNSLELIKEAMVWWEDAVAKEAQFDDMVECAEKLQSNDSWNENVKEALHSDLMSITTADGLIDVQDGTVSSEKKLAVVNAAMKLFEDKRE